MPVGLIVDIVGRIAVIYAWGASQIGGASGSKWRHSPAERGAGRVLWIS
jgi:hypothetical protein